MAYSNLDHVKKLAAPMGYVGRCDGGMTGSTTAIVSRELAGFGEDHFNTDYVMVILLDDDGHGTAPEGEVKDISNYVTSTGTFTTAAFTVNIEENDVIWVVRRELLLIDFLGLKATPATNSLAYRISQFIASGDGDFAGGTALPSNISLYDILAGTNGIPTAWPGGAAPAGGVSMAEVLEKVYDDQVIIDVFHDVATANAVTNVVMSDVIGNKTDAAVQDGDATEKSIIALLKGVHDVLWDADGLVAWEAAAAPAVNVSMAAVLRSVYDDTHEIQTDWADGGRLDLILDDIEDKTHEVDDVVIYPVAEDMATTEITDDGTSPALTAQVSKTVATEAGSHSDASWTEDIDFEQQGTAITVISIYYELHWQQRFTVGVGAGTESLAKWQISGDGGSTWVDVTDNVSEVNAAYQDETRAGVGRHITTITAGANQLQLRLCAWVDADGNSSVETKVRSDSYIRVTYRKS